MCEIETLNLIDLTSDDEESSSPTSIKKNTTELLDPAEQQKSNGDRDSALTSRGDPFEDTIALVNNERDCDPFENVEQAANLKSSNEFEQAVNMEKLLKISDDMILEDDPPLNSIKTVEQTKTPLHNDLDKETPPIEITEQIPCTPCDRNIANKLKKIQENRSNLLKLSLTNAIYNSPNAINSSLETLDLDSTPKLTNLFKKDWNVEPMLASESPIKFVDDDFVSDEAQQLLNAEKKFEEDLEMMRIHIPEHFPTTTVLDVASSETDQINNINKASIEQNMNQDTILSLSAIKSKLKTKHVKARDVQVNQPTQNADALIQNLESLISSEGGINEEKKKQATLLLEALKTTLSETKLGNGGNITQVSVPSLKRQGTFHVEAEDELVEENQSAAINEMPNCMINSAATFDGETNEDKEHLNLPEISPISPIETTSVTPYYQDNTQQINPSSESAEIHQLMDVLNKLLTTTTTTAINTTPDTKYNSDALQKSTNTFIVFMNNNNDVAQQTHDCSALGSTLQIPNAFDDSDITELNAEPRRRSQSLSLHDKVKIIKLPSTPITTAPAVQCQQINENTTKPPSPCTNKVANDLKTPAKMIRRNSYSSTPYTSSVSNSRFNTGNTSIISSQKNSRFDTHYENSRDEEPNTKSMPLFSKPLPVLKLDTKKKSRLQTESIVKSSQPMKATIPMDKVSPLIVRTPATPTKIVKRPNENLSRNKTLVNACEPPKACSTPALLPTKTKDATLAKSRFSLSSTSTNLKASVSTNLSNIRRRSTSEFKSKSPLNTRVSNTALATAAQDMISSRSSSKPARLSLKTPIKIGNKFNGGTGTGRLSNSTAHSRISTSNRTTTFKNKENKRP